MHSYSFLLQDTALTQRKGGVLFIRQYKFSLNFIYVHEKFLFSAKCVSLVLVVLLSLIQLSVGQGLGICGVESSAAISSAQTEWRMLVHGNSFDHFHFSNYKNPVSLVFFCSRRQMQWKKKKSKRVFCKFLSHLEILNISQSIWPVVFVQ